MSECGDAESKSGVSEPVYRKSRKMYIITALPLRFSIPPHDDDDGKETQIDDD